LPSPRRRSPLEKSNEIERGGLMGQRDKIAIVECEFDSMWTKIIDRQAIK
jgi:hypothetical protein